MGTLAFTQELSSQSCDPYLDLDDHISFQIGSAHAHAAIDKLLKAGYAALNQAPSKQDLEQLFESARTQAKNEEDICGEALADYGLASALRFTNSESHPTSVQSQQLVEDAEKLFEQIGSQQGMAAMHQNLAWRAYEKNDEKKRQELFRKAITEFRAAGNNQAALVATLSLLLQQISKNEVLAALQAIITEARDIKAPGVEAQAYHLWGDNDNSDGNYSSALEKYNRAKQLLEQCGCSKPELAALFVSMGRMERQQGQPVSALVYYRQALRLQLKTSHFFGAVQTLNAMGVAYGEMNQPKKALAQYLQALHWARRTGSRQHILFALGSVGYEYEVVGEYRKAADILSRVVAEEKNPYLLCYRNWQFARALSHLHEYDKASAAADKAVTFGRKSNNKEALGRSLLARVEIREQQKNYDAALGDARELLSIVEDVRSHLTSNDTRKQGFNDEQYEAYNDTIRLLSEMGKQREGLEVAEQSRARAFMDLLATQESSALRDTSPVLVASASPAAGSTTSSSGKVSRENGLEPRGAKTKSSVAKAIELASAAYATSYTADQIIQAAKRLHSTILSYWTTPDSIYIWTAHEDGTITEKRVLISEPSLRRLVAQTRLSLSASRGASVQKPKAQNSKASEVQLASTPDEFAAWHRLYQLLIAPVQDQLPKPDGSLLTIVPHGVLFQVSFAALRDEKGKYLVEHYALHTVPAVGLLQFTEQNEKAAAELPVRYLLVGAPSNFAVSPGDKPLPALPSTVTEVNAISKLFPAEQIVRLEGREATETALREQISNASVVHIATHTVLDDAHPFNSFLALENGSDNSAGVQTDEGKDGRLTTAEIYQLKLHARLVTLSACRSGLGRINEDGIVGMSRAFFYAGSASLLSTLWDVADQPTSLLLPRFYRALSEQHSSSESLRIAQMELIHELRQGHVRVHTQLGTVRLPENPAYWAAFTLSGEP